MEGSGDGVDGSGGDGVQGSGKGSSRGRSLRLRRPQKMVQVYPEGRNVSPVRVSSGDRMEGIGDSRERNDDGMEANEVGRARWRSVPTAGSRVSSWQSISDNRVASQVHGATVEEIEEGSRSGIGDEKEVTEVSDWRNPRERRHARMRFDNRNRQAPIASSVAHSSERSQPGHFAEFDRRSRGAEASGSGVRDAPKSSSVVAVSSDEERRGLVLGKEPSHDVIDLVTDSPPYGSARVEGMALFHGEGTINGEAGPSRSSTGSPLRRFMQRPAWGPAKRPRGLLQRSGRGYSEGPTDQVVDPLHSNYAQESILSSGDQRNAGSSLSALSEPYNLRRSRNINMGPSTVNSGMDASSNIIESGVGRRLGRHRFRQTGPGTSSVFSDLSSLGRPTAVPSETGDESTEAQLDPPVELEHPESPTVLSVTPGNTIVLEDDAETDRARQLAEDERVARELQDSFAADALGGEQAPTDEMLARMLQDEENAHSRGLPLGRRPMIFVPSGMQALLGDMEYQREAQRPTGQAEDRDNAASSSRAVRRSGYGRSSAFNRIMNPQAAARSNNMEEGRVSFPSTMGLESRLEFLAALEMVFQEQLPVGLQLAHVDRDFNENDYEMLLALDTDNDRHRGASQESIGQLPVTTITPTDVCEEDCSICLEVPVTGDIVRRLPCMHVFHQQCIDKWLQCQAVCPVCKAHI